MPTCKFREMEKACKKKGLECKIVKKSKIYRGFINGRFVRIPVHVHSGGRDIPTGIFFKMIKRLGFKNQKEFFDFLREI